MLEQIHISTIIFFELNHYQTMENVRTSVNWRQHTKMNKIDLLSKAVMNADFPTLAEP